MKKITKITSPKEKIKLRKKLFNKLIGGNEDSDSTDSDRISVTEHKNLIIDNLVENTNDQTHVFF